MSEIRNENFKAVSKQELVSLVSWVNTAENVLLEVKTSLTRIFAVYSNLVQGAARAKKTLTTLRQAMGIIPTSERGKSLKSEVQVPAVASEAISTEGLDPEELKRFKELEKKMKELKRQKSEYLGKLKSLGKFPDLKPEQMSFELAKPNEMLFSFPVGYREETTEEPKVDRMNLFGMTKGLHVAHDKPKRVEVKLVVTEIEYKVETVTDPETGKSVRPSMADAGPEGCQYTWTGIANLMKLHVGFAIPLNRLSLMIGQAEFTPTNIYRALRRTALSLLPIYLYLAEELSDSEILSGDDKVTKVLQATEAADPEALSWQIDEALGFTHPYASGKGVRQALNVSLLLGKPIPDPRSTIRFFRTHVVSVGNLLTSVLKFRNPKSGDVIFQGDLSSTNLPSPEFREKFKLALAGCGAHARRPFFRYRKDDESLCYFMLRGFLMLSPKFRKTRDGRAVLDVLRTINSTCMAADIDPAELFEVRE